MRSAWRLLAVASPLYLGGDVAQTVYEAQGNFPFPSVADALYLSFYPLMLWGLLRFPAGPRDRGARIRLMLDLAVVALGGGMIVTYVVLGPTLRQGGADALANVVSVAYPVGDLILLVGLGSVVLRRTALSSVRALQFMAAGLLFFVSADMVYGYIQLHSTYQGGDPVDSLWMVAIALFAVAGSAQRSPDSTSVAERDRRTASWAPYVAVAAGFGLLIIDHRDLTLTIAGVVLAGLVSLPSVPRPARSGAHAAAGQARVSARRADRPAQPAQPDRRSARRRSRLEARPAADVDDLRSGRLQGLQRHVRASRWRSAAGSRRTPSTESLLPRTGMPTG